MKHKRHPTGNLSFPRRPHLPRGAESIFDVDEQESPSSSQATDYTPRRRMHPAIHIIFSGLCLALVFTLSLTQQTGAAMPDPAACGVNEESCQLQANFSAVQGEEPPGLGFVYPWNPPAPTEVIGAANSSAFGALIYDDFHKIEIEARTKLQRALMLRESMSPYGDDNDFDTIVRKLDVEAGFSTVITPTTAIPGYPASASLNTLITLAEQDFAEARNLYAVLFVQAPLSRFRTEGYYITDTDKDTWHTAGGKTLCDTTERVVPPGELADPDNPLHPMEMPFPQSDPETNPGVVLPPRYDWCDFQARLRQSAREAANIRMIYGQEWKVDALGVNFSGNLLGGNAFVMQEIANLNAAKFQFEQAEAILADALNVAVGNGCLVSDFFTDAEWSLLSRASEEQGNLQYLIASRMSYLGGGTQLEAQAAAGRNYRQSAVDQYIKLVGFAGLSGSQPAGCPVAIRPDGNLVADMASNILETQRLAREMTAGRNVFGFDVTMTPARFYKTFDTNTARAALNNPLNRNAPAMTDLPVCGLSAGSRGLWDAAYCSAVTTRALQLYQEDAERDFDSAQADLRDAIQALRAGDADNPGIHERIEDVSGCNATNLGSQEALAACVDEQVAFMKACLKLVGKDDDAAFDTCMANVDGTEGQTALTELRSIFLEFKSIELQANNIDARITASNDANATVTHWLDEAGTDQRAADIASAVAEGVSCIDHGLDSYTASLATCGVSAAANAAAAGIAGATSTEAEVEIANAENAAEITNLLLDQTELLIDARAATQAFYSAKAGVEGMIGDLEDDLREERRQRAWLTTLPANDPAFRMVRDSARLALAKELEDAARLAYLAARRAEYEYAYPLSQASGFRISDIYRARTADDILAFLVDLADVTDNLPGDQPGDTTTSTVRLSVAEDVLRLNDERMRLDVIAGGTPCDLEEINEEMVPTAACAAEIEAERIAQFRAWVPGQVQNVDGNDRIVFEFPTSVVTGGMFAQNIDDFHLQWLHRLGGQGFGVSVNVLTDQTFAENPDNVPGRALTLTQAGVSHMRARTGCVFDYRLVEPGAIFGYTLPSGIDGQNREAVFRARINAPQGYDYADDQMMTPAFDGRPISAMSWQFSMRVTSNNQPGLNLAQLNDIELILRHTLASTAATTNPTPAICTRIDW